MAKHIPTGASIESPALYVMTASMSVSLTRPKIVTCEGMWASAVWSRIKCAASDSLSEQEAGLRSRNTAGVT
jgi:hypothetical protein